MNSLLQLQIRVLEESGTLCGIATNQDVKTVLDRVKSEGLSFLTITLSSYFSDLQKALDRGYVAADLFPSFKRKKGEPLPLFLGGFLQLAFNKEDGRISVNADSSEAIDAIRAVFQITGLLKRLKMDCNPKRVKQTFFRYMETDAMVQLHMQNLSDLDLDRFSRMANLLFGPVFRGVSHDIQQEELIPRHGPGATADKLKGNQKFDPVKQSWPEELELYFPRGRYGYSSYGIYQDEVDSGTALSGTVMPSKVIAVPKTQKTPRLIAIEPTVMQYAQQALLESIWRNLRTKRIARIMSWEHQEPNQLLALKGSIPYMSARVNGSYIGGLATLDLSDASDRVGYQLVKTMARHFPAFGYMLDATRSKQADVNGTIIDLAKYASMGNAVTFPLESMVFTTIVFLGLEEAFPTIPPWELVRSFSGVVRVYGDDIVVPVRAAQSVVRLLETYGLKVNRDKSFWTGTYRESCGKEYFCGVDVTIARCSRDIPSPLKPRSKQVSEIQSTVALRNNLFKRGYYQTAAWLDSLLEVVLKGHYPLVEDTSPVLGRVEYEGHQVDAFHSTRHIPLVKGWVVKEVIPQDKLEGYGALVKTLGNRSEMPIFDAEHLERGGRPQILRMKLGLHPAY